MQAFERGHAFFMGAAALFLLFSMLCRFMIGVILKRLIREAENMSATENGLLKSLSYCIYREKGDELVCCPLFSGNDHREKGCS